MRHIPIGRKERSATTLPDEGQEWVFTHSAVMGNENIGVQSTTIRTVIHLSYQTAGYSAATPWISAPSAVKG